MYTIIICASLNYSNAIADKGGEESRRDAWLVLLSFDYYSDLASWIEYLNFSNLDLGVITQLHRQSLNFLSKKFEFSYASIANSLTSKDGLQENFEQYKTRLLGNGSSNAKAAVFRKPYQNVIVRTLNNGNVLVLRKLRATVLTSYEAIYTQADETIILSKKEKSFKILIFHIDIKQFKIKNIIQ